MYKIQLHKLKVYNEDNKNIIPTHIEVDGHIIHNCYAVEYSQRVDEIPACTIKVNALPDLNALAEINFHFTPQTVEDSIKVIQSELIHSKETDEEGGLYDNLIDHIAYALKDIPKEAGLYDTAEIVSDKIMRKDKQKSML